MEIKKDCFAYDESEIRPKCMALNKLYCKVGECGFYKTANQACKECTYTNCRNCPVGVKKYR